MKLIVTGGAGFIGSRFVKLLLEREPAAEIIVHDKLSYSGDESRLSGLKEKYPSRYRFEKIDIAQPDALSGKLAGVHAVFHFAAESHVDRSLLDSKVFFEANAAGTQTLLTEARSAGVKKFIHVSTDEVYGSRAEGAFRETDSLNPTNPYSVSKAAAEYLALNAFRHTALPVVITRGSNTYGPWQYPEKVIPLFVANALSGKPMPLYGDGSQERDWLHVDDHCEAVYFAYRHGAPGEIYNVSGGFHLTNLELTRRILKALGLQAEEERLIQRVTDRLGHDRRYAMDDTKLRALGWKPVREFDSAFAETVQWYQKNTAWLDGIRRKSEDYDQFYRRQYAERTAAKR